MGEAEYSHGYLINQFLNSLVFRPGKTRGFHFHPHFEEYLLVVDGNGTLVTRKIPESKESEEFIHLSKGTSSKTEKIHHTI